MSFWCFPQTCLQKQRRSGERSSQAACFHDAWELLFFLVYSFGPELRICGCFLRPSPTNHPASLFSHLIRPERMLAHVWLPLGCAAARQSHRSQEGAFSGTFCSRPPSNAVGCFRKFPSKAGKMSTAAWAHAGPKSRNLGTRRFNLTPCLPLSGRH